MSLNVIIDQGTTYHSSSGWSKSFPGQFCKETINFSVNVTVYVLSIDSETGLDQLDECIKRKLCFSGFLEEKIKFMPTYKYNPYTSIYDTSQTLRQPSFTESILL